MFSTTYLGEWALNQEESPVAALCEKFYEKIMAEQEEKLSACMNERRNNMNEFTIIVRDIPREGYAAYRQEVVDRLHNNKQYVISDPYSKYLLHTTNGRLWLIPFGGMGGGMHIMADCEITAQIGAPLDVVAKVVEYERKVAKTKLNSIYGAATFFGTPICEPEEGLPPAKKTEFVNYAKADVAATQNLYQQSLAICKKMARMSHMSSIKKVVFNPPATIVYWADDSKTVVKAQGLDSFDKTTGLAMAVAKKHFGNDSYFNEIFRKWIPEYDEVKSVSFLDKRLHTPADDARDLVNGAKRALDAVVSSVATAKEHLIETCRERLKREHPEWVDPEVYLGGCLGCPSEYGYRTDAIDECKTAVSATHDEFVDACTKCWDRPVEEKKPFNEPEVTHLTPPTKKDLQEFVKDGDRTPATFGPKYEFTGETRQAYGCTLHRIRAVRDIYFPSGRLFVKKGELGGWIESEANLSHCGSCWVGENACVTKHARVFGNAYVHGCASVRDHAMVFGDATICEFARVIGDAVVIEEAYVHGHALVCQTAIDEGNAEVCGGARLKGKVHVTGRACVAEGVHREGVIDE